GSRTIHDLTAFIQTTMPPAAPGSLAEKTCVEIVAYLLESNGAAAGNQPLAANANTAIRSVASGIAASADAGAGRGGRGGRGAAGGRGGQSGIFPVNLAPARGLTTEGKVENYIPVTD